MYLFHISLYLLSFNESHVQVDKEFGHQTVLFNHAVKLSSTIPIAVRKALVEFLWLHAKAWYYMR